MASITHSAEGRLTFTKQPSSSAASATSAADTTDTTHTAAAAAASPPRPASPPRAALWSLASLRSLPRTFVRGRATNGDDGAAATPHGSGHLGGGSIGAWADEEERAVARFAQFYLRRPFHGNGNGSDAAAVGQGSAGGDDAERDPVPMEVAWARLWEQRIVRDATLADADAAGACSLAEAMRDRVSASSRRVASTGATAIVASSTREVDGRLAWDQTRLARRVSRGRAEVNEAKSVAGGRSDEGSEGGEASGTGKGRCDGGGDGGGVAGSDGDSVGIGNSGLSPRSSTRNVVAAVGLVFRSDLGARLCGGGGGGSGASTVPSHAYTQDADSSSSLRSAWPIAVQCASHVGRTNNCFHVKKFDNRIAPVGPAGGAALLPCLRGSWLPEEATAVLSTVARAQLEALAAASLMLASNCSSGSRGEGRGVGGGGNDGSNSGTNAVLPSEAYGRCAYEQSARRVSASTIGTYVNLVAQHISSERCRPSSHFDGTVAKLCGMLADVDTVQHMAAHVYHAGKEGVEGSFPSFPSSEDLQLLLAAQGNRLCDWFRETVESGAATQLRDHLGDAKYVIGAAAAAAAVAAAAAAAAAAEVLEVTVPFAADEDERKAAIAKWFGLQCSSWVEAVVLEVLMPTANRLGSCCICAGGCGCAEVNTEWFSCGDVGDLWKGAVEETLEALTELLVECRVRFNIHGAALLQTEILGIKAFAVSTASVLLPDERRRQAFCDDLERSPVLERLHLILEVLVAPPNSKDARGGDVAVWEGLRTAKQAKQAKQTKQTKSGGGDDDARCTVVVCPHLTWGRHGRGVVE